jgi:hypothetical protein
VSGKLEVVHDGSAVPEASIIVVRVVNTGDKAIRFEDFSSELTIRLKGVREVVSALATKTRPIDLVPKLMVKDSRVLIGPLLVNPGDMVELQLLTSGLASGVVVEGRVADAVITRRGGLPYPPGTGPEGELANTFERVFWYAMPCRTA